MAEFWASSGLDLLIETRRARRRSSLEESLRSAIESGRLPYGSRLPSTRSLARDLGWARGTVAAAYHRLVAEGYLHARQGAATVVGYRGEQQEAAASDAPPWPQWRYDLRPGTVPFGSFPAEEWVRHQSAALRAAPLTSFGYGDPAGAAQLRTALAAYLGRVRGVRAGPDDIIVTAGITQAVRLLAGILMQRHPGRPVAAEDPGFWFHRRVLADAGVPVIPLPVDVDGADPAQLAGSGACAALVTPAHQYPVGVTMGRARRRALVEWARGEDALIIEDDYDGELGHDGAPTPALQADAPDRVIYAGTASKALSPALRLGWIVVPEALRETVRNAQYATLHNLDMLSQLTLAHYIEHHAYDGRVRATRVQYRRRYAQLAELVSEVAVDVPGMRLGGARAGGQVPLLLPEDGRGEAALVDAAARAHLALEPISASSHTPGTHPPALVIGYSRPADHRYSATLEVLARVLRAPM